MSTTERPGTGERQEPRGPVREDERRARAAGVRPASLLVVEPPAAGRRFSPADRPVRVRARALL